MHGGSPIWARGCVKSSSTPLHVTVAFFCKRSLPLCCHLQEVRSDSMLWQSGCGRGCTPEREFKFLSLGRPTPPSVHSCVPSSVSPVGDFHLDRAFSVHAAPLLSLSLGAVLFLHRRRQFVNADRQSGLRRRRRRLISFILLWWLSSGSFMYEGTLPLYCLSLSLFLWLG